MGSEMVGERRELGLGKAGCLVIYEQPSSSSAIILGGDAALPDMHACMRQSRMSRKFGALCASIETTRGLPVCLGSIWTLYRRLVW